jgi:hypothetical protein
MLLDENTSQLKIQLGAPTNTGPVDVTVQYADTIQERTTVKTLFVQTSFPGPVTILDAPAAFTARNIKELHFCNADDTDVTVQVLLQHAAGSQFIQNVGLAPGDTLHYNEFNGWSIQVAGNGGRGAVMRRYRLVTFADTPVSVTLFDDVIDVDASGGTVVVKFDPALVVLANYIKEIEVNKVDASANLISLQDNIGTNIDVIVTPINGTGGNGGQKFIRSDGTNLRTAGVG